MAKKKTGARKGTRKAPSMSVSIKTNLKKIFAGVTFLIFIVAAAGFLAKYLVINRDGRQTVQTIAKRTTPQKEEPKAPLHKKTNSFKKRQTTPAFEIYPEEKTPPPAAVKPIPPATDTLPRVAIIIDDIGHDKTISDQLLSLDAELTFAILPHSPHQNEIAKAAHKKGIELMLHLPMEPLEYPQVDPGPGALLTSMPPDQLLRQLNRNLDAVPHIAGVNNHMGSKMTSISTQMYQIFTILKKKDLYFVDSRTSIATLCRPSARLLQIPFGQRDVFLDHLQTAKAIRRQLNRLVKIAEQNGQAIGIGHPHPITYEVLRQELPALKKKIRLVPASELVHKLG